MTKTRFFSICILSIAAATMLGPTGVRAGGAETVQTAKSPTSSPDRLAAMEHHFSLVFVLHEALIRGDLAAVRAPAAQLAQLPSPPGLADAGRPFVESIRQASRQAAEARTLVAAASAVASMLKQCGDCHRTVGVPVAVTMPTGHDVGGIVGHMLDHQRAADDLLQGLFVPSASQWKQGAERLSMATVLQSDRLPSDPKLTVALGSAEARVHAIALQAEGDADPDARAARYAQIIVTCANCHSLHSRIWGPTRGR